MTAPNSHDWLIALQRDIPLTRRPFADIGKRFSMTEDEVLSALKDLFEVGKARRFGAVFDVRRLGYRSALCAVRVPDAELDACAAGLTPYRGMTHCYLRGWPAELPADMPGAPQHADLPNLWFTISELSDTFDETINAIRAQLLPMSLRVLPAIRRFKIDVIFHPDSRNVAELVPSGTAPSVQSGGGSHDEVTPSFSEVEKQIVRSMQGSMPLVATPYDQVAEEVGWSPDRLINHLREWHARGVLRRIGTILRHRSVGFSANGMCVWRVDPADTLRAGRALATFREVTHCYEREVVAGFPYNVFAMIHAGGYAAVLERYRQLSDAAGLVDGGVLFSLREFKKISPRYFSEED